MQRGHEHQDCKSQKLRSTAATLLLVLIAAIGSLLLYDHRTHLLSGNGLLITLLLVCVGSHFFMHGGRSGGHGRDRKKREPRGPGDAL